MSSTIRTLLTAAALLGGMAPSTARAQTARKSAPPVPAYVAVEKEANQLLQSPSTWLDGAAAQERAAALRHPDDPRAIRDLLVAAGAYYWGGNKTHARRTYVKAGECALGLGDLETATHAWVRAAIIAKEQKDPAAAVALMHRAQRLSTATVAQGRMMPGEQPDSGGKVE